MPAHDPEKPYTLTFDHRPEYLYAAVCGDKDSYAISKQYWMEIAAHLKETDYRRLLIDEDIEQAASVTDVFQLVSELPGMGFTGIRVAFCDRKIEHKDLNDFGELVGSNRGLNGRVFNDVKLAEEWIEGP